MRDPLPRVQRGLAAALRDRRTQLSAAAFVLTALACYLYVLVGNINNYDNIVCTPEGYGTGLRSGRWMLTLLGDTVGHAMGNFNLPLFNGLLGLAFLGLACQFLWRALHLQKPWQCAVLTAITAAWPAAASAMLFSFTVHYYLFAVLLAAVAVWMADRRGWGWFVGASLTLACSIGVYQAYFPLAAALLVLRLLQQCLDSETPWKTVALRALRFVGVLAAAMVVYFLLLHLCLRLYHETLTAYRGINNMGKLNFAELPQMLVRCVRCFYLLPKTGYAFLTNSRLIRWAMWASLLLSAVSLALAWRDRDWKKIVTVVLLLAALAAIHYKRQHPAAILVGLDTQLAQEWLSDHEDGKLPDLIGINLESDTDARVDIIEVKTYADNPNAFTIDGDTISGHAVEQVTALESLTQEMLGKAEKITTISRREILREQVFECLFQATLDPASKLRYSNMLNDLFAGEYNVSVRRNIAFVDFENTESSEKVYKGIDDFLGKDYTLITIGSSEVQAILANTVFACEAGPLNPAFQDEAVASPQATYEANVVGPVQEETAWPEHSPVAPDTAHAYVADAPSTPVAPAAPVTNETDTELQRTDLREKCARINKVFRDYGINAYPVDPNMVQEAARFTRFSVELKSGETIRTLERFKTDIGIQLEANGEILIDHIKGTKYLSVDVPFAGAGKAISLLKHLNLLDGSSGALDFVAGQKADGRFEVVDIAKAPHMLIAGTTGSGKTIFLYSIIVSLLHKYPMEDLEFLIIDPKQTDFVFFEDLPNLYGGHVVVDAEEALEMIQRINDVDKEGRMQQLRFCRSRDIGSYNEKNPDHRMKRLIIIIDEYADLIQTAEMQGKRKEFEKFLSMLAQKVRSLGIHLIIATQRPSANIVTGVLKANIPYRISFRLPSHTDSQTILDMPGAENLLGKGDMLMVTDSDTIRMQGLYISEDELDNFVKSRQ